MKKRQTMRKLMFGAKAEAIDATPKMVRFAW